jgi:hypothetical protein
MSLLDTLKSLISRGPTPYVVVWREYAPDQTTMRAEPIPAKSDSEAIAMARSRCTQSGSNWVFWVVFRPDDEMVTAERGAQIAGWPHSFNRVGTDSHVQSTLRAFRTDGKPIHRSLKRITLKDRGPFHRVEEN